MPQQQRPTPNLPPQRGFHDPADVAAAPLSHDHKLRILREWEQDLRALLVATDENMTPARPGNSGELLRSVRRTIATLNRSEGPDEVRKSSPSRRA